jgi:hypothetical protein
MAPITKILHKTKVFAWTVECQEMWETIKQWYLNALILIVTTLALGLQPRQGAWKGED